MTDIEVFADILCPFTHVGLRRVLHERHRRARPDVRFIVRAWPLELVNGAPLEGATLAPKVAALRATVAPDLFEGFDPTTFPSTSLPALALVAAAYRHGVAAGELLSMRVRTAVFEGGADISNRATLQTIADSCDLPRLIGDGDAVYVDWKEGIKRKVQGSPHFFLPTGDYFCPSLDITHHDGGLQIAFDDSGYAAFAGALFD